jgi:hypothetical protein
MSRLQELRAADQGKRLDLNMLRFAEMPLVSRRAPDSEEKRARVNALPVPVSACNVIAPEQMQEVRKAAGAKRAASDLARIKKEVAEAFKNGPVSATEIAELRGITKQAGNLQARDWVKRGLIRFLELRPVMVKGCKAGTLVSRNVQFFEVVK